MVCRLLLVLFLPAALGAQAMTHRQYAAAAGLPWERVEQVVTDSNGYVYARRGGKWLRFDGTDFLPVARPAAADHDNLWMSPRELTGVSDRYLRNSPLAGIRLTDVAEDVQGRLWLATEGAGLLRILPVGVKEFGPAEGLPLGGVTGWQSDTKNLRAICGDRGVYLYQDQRFTPDPFIPEPGGTQIVAMETDTDGAVYYATTDRGLAVADSSGLTFITTGEGLPDDRLREVALFGSRVWVLGHRGELSAIARGDSSWRVENFGPSAGLPDLPYRKMRATAKGLLLTTEAGMIIAWSPHRDSRRITGLPRAGVAALSIRRGRQVWAAMNGKGVFYTDLGTDNPQFYRVPDRYLPPATDYRALLARGAERDVWVASERGITRLVLDDQGQPLYVHRYGPAEGVVDPDVRPAAAIADRYGNLWFGTATGALRFDRDAPEIYLPPPSTRLTGLQLLYDSIDIDRVAFGAEEDHLTFRFKAVDLTHPDRIQYRYRLRPLERDWSVTSTDTEARYAGLAGGSYIFQAQATTDGGRTWGAAAEHRFRIAAPLYQRAWLLAAVVVLLGGAMIGGTYYAFHRLRRREARAREELRRENELLRLEQQARQLQMNPHFIFNALNSIRGLVDRPEAREQLARFAGLLRAILNNSRQDHIPLATEIATLTDYLEMERFCHPAPFHYTIRPPGDVDPEEISLPPMLLQPFVENAILHGFRAMDRPAELSVTFCVRGRRMQCLIQDNGIGRAAAGKRRTSLGHQSLATAVTRERVAALGGSLQIEDGQPYGTWVTIEIPIYNDW